MFKDELKRLRKIKGYSMDELAEAYNRKFNGKLNKSTISRYENGLQEPMLYVVKNLAELFDVSIDELSTGYPKSDSLDSDQESNALNIEVSSKIGSRIKKRRQELDMTLEEVGKFVGLSRQTIQRYESGVIENIPSDKIELLAKCLKTTPSYLMGWDEPIKTIGYHEPEISPFIDVDALEAKKRREEKKAAKQESKNDLNLDELDKTMLSLFQSLSTIEKCEIITQLKKKST